MKVSFGGTIYFGDLSSIKVYATQTHFLNGNIKAYSYKLAEGFVSLLANTGSIDIKF